MASSQEKFVIKFDGPAVAAHRIDVRALAPALIGLADAIAATHVTAGDGVNFPPALEIGPPEAGSFMAELFVAWNDVADLMTSHGMETTLNAGDLIVLFTAAVRWATARGRFGGRQSEIVEPIGAGQVRITYPDGTVIEADARAGQVIENLDFNRAMLTATEPLRVDGVDSLALEVDGETLAELKQSDRPTFNVGPQPDQIVSENHRIVTVDILKPSFKTGNKWRVTDGDTPFWVTIVDPEFQRQIEERRVRFAKGDRLTVEILDEQVIDGHALHVEHSVTRVLRHWTVPPADELPFAAD